MFHLLNPYPDYIHIQNFKAIGKAQRVPIRPITLLFGQNSAGKSSVLHAIALIAHFAEHGLKQDPDKVELNGSVVRTGNFKTYRHRGAKGRDRTVLGWQYKPGEHSKNRDVIERISLGITGLGELLAAELTVEKDGTKLFSAQARQTRKPVKGSINTFASGALLIGDVDEALVQAAISSARKHLSAKIAEATMSKSVRKSALLIVGSTALDKEIRHSFLENAQRIAIDEVRFQLSQMMPRNLLDIFDHDQQAVAALRAATKPALNERLLKSILVKWAASAALGAFIADLNELPYAEVRNVVYFGKHREEVGQDDIFTKSDVRKGTTPTHQRYAKGWAFDDVAVSNVNEWLRQTKRPELEYELKLVELIDFQEVLPLETKYLLQLYDKRQEAFVSFNDVGAGIGQLLPVLLAANAEAGSVVLVEQPELHLHPALQAEIADAFVYSALGNLPDGDPIGNRFVLETHSEHMLLRLMRRIRQTTTKQLPKGFPALRPDDVAILYVEKSPSSSGSIIRELRLNEMGQLIDDWPGGFFEEGLREVLM